MIWDSVPLMTLIDLSIVSLAVAAIAVVWRARSALAEADALRASAVLISGLALIGAFYLFDLITMWVLPRTSSPAAAMVVMENLHLNWNWVVSVAAVVSIFVGFAGIVQSEVGLAERLGVAREKLQAAESALESVERELVSAERRFEEALDAANMGWWVYHLTTGRVEWSEQTARIYAVPLEDFDGTIETYRTLIHPDDRAELRQAVVNAIEHGGIFGTEHRRVLPDGATRWIAGRGQVFSEGDEPTVLRGVAWDITDQKVAEAARDEAVRSHSELERRLNRQQRLEALGTLSGGIAHDFNNLLTPILGHIEMLTVGSRDQDERDRLGQIQIAAERARGLVRQILAFSGKIEPVSDAVEVEVALDQAVDLVRATLPASVEIRRAFDPDCGSVEADPTQLTQVILNLCTNAAHAMPRGGILDIQATPVEMDQQAVEAYPELSPGPHVRITVSDTGVGMSDGVMERAFEPFFTTKDVGAGTGLGLSQVLGIVHSYGGTVMLYSEEGLGSTVHVYLPAASSGATEASVHRGAIVSGSGRVLVVDDEVSVAETLSTMLQSLGYETVTETSPRSALDRFEKIPGSFDLLITDQTMPGMSGLELIDRVRSAKPDFPTVLMSGFADPTHEVDGGVIFLMKPFTRIQLSEATQTALAGTNAPY